MEMQNFNVEFTVRKFWPYIRPDYFNNTTMFLNDMVVWPLELEDWEDPPALPAPGIKFRLEIPSGVLAGTVEEVIDINDILQVWKIGGACWVGKYAGLANGNCGIGSFRCFANPATVVKSSIATEDLTYTEYSAVRRAVEAACRGGTGEAIWLSPEANQELMRSALACLRKLRQEAERMSANS